MAEVSRTAKFNAADPPSRILEDLACPACGHQDPGGAHRSSTDDAIRIFCDCCGAFITIALSEEQAEFLRSRSAVL